MPHAHPTYFTPGDISRLLGQPISRINYVIESRGIQPASRVGVIRLFTEDARELIESELARIDAKRSRAVTTS